MDDSQEIWIKYTIAEVAAKLGISARWLADECRRGRVTHVHMARQRWFTHQQVKALIAKNTVQAGEDLGLEIAREIVRERASRAFRRPKMVQKDGRWVVAQQTTDRP